jgi:protein TonB
MQVADAYLNSFSSPPSRERGGRVFPIVTTVAVHALILFGIAVSTGMVPVFKAPGEGTWVEPPKNTAPPPIETLPFNPSATAYVPPRPDRPVIDEEVIEPPTTIQLRKGDKEGGKGDGAVVPPAPQSTHARILRSSEPFYPSLSRIKEEEGVVLVRITITARGTVSDVHVEKSSGFARLDEAALASVRNWRFVPAKRGDEAIATSVLVPVRFELKRG